jgi:hypothetical protein
LNDTYNNGLVCGRVYAFDRNTGEHQWQVPALIDLHGYVAGQGTELPVLIFLRQAYQRQMKVSMLCLDKRTGRAVYQNDNLGGQAHAFEATADPEARTVAMQFPGQSVQLNYTDAPVAPEPPYQAGAEAPREAAASKTAFGKFFEILEKAADEVDEGGKQQPRLAPPRLVPELPPPADPFGGRR